MENYSVPLLPPKQDLETKRILKRLPAARAALAELKGVAKTIPNEEILINTLVLQEAKDSSEIENIITTHDDLYKSVLFEDFNNPAAKEVAAYAEALKYGFNLVRNNKILTENNIIEIQGILQGNDAGYRKQAGTVIKNMTTGETVYTPPQDPQEIIRLMRNLAEYINDGKLSDIDPLIKMAIIHWQFESIHPFYDGNGRTGRIINILYLVLNEMLDLPILYLSRYIIKNKSEYYRLLQQTRDTGAWEEWLLYMINGVEETSLETIELIKQIKNLMQDYKQRIRGGALTKIYSQDLLNNLFKHPYTKIEYIMNDLNVSRLTANRYLDLLIEEGFLQKYKIGRTNLYVNMPLFDLFKGESSSPKPAEIIKTIN